MKPRLPICPPSNRGLVCGLVLVAEADGDAPDGMTRRGRWCLNDGGITLQWMPDVSDSGQVAVIVDLASVSFAHDPLPCIWEHWGQAIGKWNAMGVIAIDGESRIEGTLDLYAPRDDTENDQFRDALHVAGLMDRDHPLEASIRTDDRRPFDAEVIPACAEVEINGRTFESTRELPIVVARNAVIVEASIVDFGANAGTGKIAAALHAHREPKKTTTEEPPMAIDIRKLQARLLKQHNAKHHGLVASICAAAEDDATEDEIEAQVERRLAEERQKAMAAENEQLKTENEELKAKVAAAEGGNAGTDGGADDGAGDGKKDEDEGEAAPAPASGVAASGKAPSSAGADEPGTGGLTYIEARRQVKAETKKKGAALEAEVAKRHPKLVASMRKFRNR